MFLCSLNIKYIFRLVSRCSEITNPFLDLLSSLYYLIFTLFMYSYLQKCILSPSSFNLYAEYIMQNARLDEAQAGIKIARRNINNLWHAYGTTLMAESEEELKSLLMKVKEWKSWLKAQHSENEDHGTRSHHFIGNRLGNSGNIGWLYFSGLQNHCRWWLQPRN